MIEITIRSSDPAIELNVSTSDESIQTEVKEGNVQVMSQDYEVMRNKPAIDGIELYKNTTLEDIGLDEITNQEIDEMFA